MNYMEVIGRKHPNCQVSCEGDPEVYANITWVEGDPLPTEGQLQADHLQLMRDDKWEEIKAERERRDEISGTKVGEKWFHTDLKSKMQQSALKTAADHNLIPQNLMWKTLDGTFVLMTNQLATLIFIGAMQRSTDIFAAAEVHRFAMQALPDPTNYSFDHGWPETFDEWKARQ